ncbi:MAG TPA: GNAT family N-acetyltransferase [Saprospiraceae bacterium]|nr:GNAT family N-acetyltransferase [Saprospiraceae bacterium]HNT20384.1 GNAT family N-acetyltransferase [Saprospiraceae bacterium]
MEKRIKLRKASLEDLELLRYWDKQEHVLESDPNDDWNWEYELQREPEWREQLIAESDGKPVGFLQIIDPALEESHYWGEVPRGLRAIDIWLGEQADLGKGLGTEMMKQTIARIFENAGINAILVDPLESNVRAHRFYERLGFRLLEKRRFGQDDCLVFRLVRKDWDQDSGL